MKRVFVLYLLVSLVCIYTIPTCFADEVNNIVLTAEKVDPQNLIGEINGRVLKEYNPIKLNITNKGSNEVRLSNNVFYLVGDKRIKAPSSAVIFTKTRRHTTRRAVLWGIASLITFGILTVPAVGGSVAHSVSTNGTLEDNIKKNNFRSRNLYEEDSYSPYIFIPKSDKKAGNVVIQVSNENDESFDIQAPIQEVE